MSRAHHKALAEAALVVGRRRAERLDEIRAALLQGEEARALALMRIHVGIDEEPNDEEGDRARQGIH